MSSYQVLARKYRPKTFADVAGQEVLTKVLQGAIRDQRVGHAYLFAGPRGTGKTTTARVLAKALICERGPAEEPCGECDHCRDLDAGSHVDVQEIDAASNTSVEDVRALREQVAYAPMRARYKIYIVDEVHMLSKSAFNAFLKTLEEPPPHVIFLFATTEPHKVLDTVLSRCQVLHLSLIPEDVIGARVAEIFELENVRCEEGVPVEIGRLARGSLRDALSFTDQLLALVGNEPTLDDVRRVGGDGEGRVEELLDLAAAGDRAGVLSALPGEEGGEARLLDACLGSLRSSLLEALRQGDAPPTPLATGTDELRRRRHARARQLGPERLRAWVDELLFARERLAPRNLPQHARLVLELALLELCRADLGLPIGELERRLEELEARLAGAPAAPPRSAASSGPAAPRTARTPARPPEQAPRAAPPPSDESEDDRLVRSQPAASTADDSAEPPPQPAPQPAPAAKKSERPPQKTVRPARASQSPRPSGSAGSTGGRSQARGTGGVWKAFLQELSATRPSLAALLERKGKLLDHGEERALIQVARATARERPLIEDAANLKACEAAIERAGGRAVRVVVEDTTRQRPGGSDPFTSEVVDLFGGHIEDNA